MSTFQIGKEIQELRSRVDAIESIVNRRSSKRPMRWRRPAFAASIGDGLSIGGTKGLLHTDHADENLLAVEWRPPFSRDNGDWWMKSGGSLSTFGDPTDNYQTGLVTNYTGCYTGNVDDDDDAYRFQEAKFWFGYRNPNRSGRLRIQVEFWIEEARLGLNLNDEPGISALDLELFQNFNVAAWKQAPNGQYEEVFKETPGYKSETRNYGPGQGGSDNWGWSATPGPWRFDHTSIITVDRDQYVRFSVGIWSGITFWTNDFGVQTTNRMNCRLDRVVAELL